jgi:hypothetical protein
MGVGKKFKKKRLGPDPKNPKIKPGNNPTCALYPCRPDPIHGNIEKIKKNNKFHLSIFFL